MFFIIFPYHVLAWPDNKRWKETSITANSLSLSFSPFHTGLEYWNLWTALTV